MKIRKAVIPAAGMGTRFLPATKAMPKEMLPVADKPVIQYVVEDAVSAGIEDIIMVTGWHKRTLEDHFDYPYELIQRLKEAGKEKQVDEVISIANLANFIYIRQKGHLGNATAILNARHIVGREAFLCLWADDFFVASPTRSQQLVAAYEEFNAPILSAIRTDRPEDTKKYAFVGGETVRPGVVRVKDIVEKPGPNHHLSNLGIVSGYVFTPDFVDHMKQVEPREGEELVYVDGLKKMIEDGHDVYAIEINDGRYYDCGNKLEYLKANIEIALRHDDYRSDLVDYLRRLDFGSR
jgi:UTP--glucose-1-phosphate uridylyltransferase